MKYQELARSVAQQSTSSRLAVSPLIWKAWGMLVGFVQMAWGSLFQSKLQMLTCLPRGNLCLCPAKSVQFSDGTKCNCLWSGSFSNITQIATTKLPSAIEMLQHKHSRVSCSHMPEYRTGYLKHEERLIKCYYAGTDCRDNRKFSSDVPCIRRHLPLWKLSWYSESQLTSQHWHK